MRRIKAVFFGSTLVTASTLAFSYSSYRSQYISSQYKTAWKIESLNYEGGSRRQRQRRRRRLSEHFYLSPNDDFGEEVGLKKRTTKKQKKNKYAAFSKTDERTLDPFDELLSESEQKLQDLQMEEAITKNKIRSTEIMSDPSERRERNKFIFPDTRFIDPRDPTTFGYTELGTILGAHGVKGLLRISAVTDFAERLCRPGQRHLKVPHRNSPREIRLLEGRYRGGRNNDEYLIQLEGIGDRDSASRLQGSVLYCREDDQLSDHALSSDEYLIAHLIGVDVYLIHDYQQSQLHIQDQSSEDAFDLDNQLEITTEVTTDQPPQLPQQHHEEEETKPSTKTPLGGSFVGTVSGIVLAEDMCSIPGLGHDFLEITLPRAQSWRDELVLIPFVPEIVPVVHLDDDNDDESLIQINPPHGLLDLTFIKPERIRIKGFLPPAKDT